ncbi:hypothetical protein [Kitasatospora sp. NPDC097691]|uniref:hypothetical protein n=1 Tax=Kitasatospora sp. NPDC097691 TaxID=3157231 RepID=UPI00332A5F26
MTDLDFERRVNPWLFDSSGNLTEAAKKQFPDLAAAAAGAQPQRWSPAPGSRVEEQAKQAADILRLAGNATDAQIDQLNKTLKEHSADPRFTTAFYQSLGPDGFLKYYGQLAVASADKGGNRPQAIADLQKNLGTALATATDTRNYPRLSDDWEAGLRRAGVARVDVWPPGRPGGSAQPFGYQILTNILRTGTYDAHFLNPIAEHVTQLSEKKGFWTSDQWNNTEFTQLKFLGSPQDSAQGGFNPMAGVLEALASAVETAPSASPGRRRAARTDALVREMKDQVDAYNKSIDENAVWGKSVWAMTGGKVLGLVPGVGAGLSLPVNYFVDQLAANYHIEVNPGDPATAADVASLNGAAEAAKKAVENAAQGTGLNPQQIEALSTGAANEVRAGAADSAGLFARAVNG